MGTQSCAGGMKLSILPDRARPAHYNGFAGDFVGSLAVLLPALDLSVQVSEAGNMAFTIDGAEADNALPAHGALLSMNPTDQSLDSQYH